MPTNQIIQYPDLLQLLDLPVDKRASPLRMVFDRDVTNNASLCFRGKRVYPIKSDGELEMSREFRHLVTKEYNADPGRSIDMQRAMRLHWIRPHIEEKVSDAHVEVFSVKERFKKYNMDVIRTYIYNVDKKYVVVLEPKERTLPDGTIFKYYFLLTAYYLDYEYAPKQMEKKMKQKLPSVV